MSEPPATDPQPSDVAFESQRAALRGLAYRMTGSLADAEDLVQEAYLRWRGLVASGEAGSVAHPRAYLKQIVTRLCLDHLRSARVRRESYVGPWLPEPLLDTGSVMPEDPNELAQDVSMALLLALERLSPLERAAFLLKDVFDADYAEVAATLAREPSTCRKLVERARRQVRAGRPRFTPSREEATRVLGAFYRALSSGNAEALARVLAEDCVVTTDGGGRVSAGTKPIVGRDRAARFFLGMAKKYPLHALRLTPVTVNGLPGVLLERDGQLHQVVAFESRHGCIYAVYGIRNPDKLRHVVTRGAPLPRRAEPTAS